MIYAAQQIRYMESLSSRLPWLIATGDRKFEHQYHGELARCPDSVVAISKIPVLLSEAGENNAFVKLLLTTLANASW
eukprot:scaffold589486_cov18-Prasinocladus_malaysianus.AAC.1